MKKTEIRKQIAEQKHALGFQGLELLSAAVVEKFQGFGKKMGGGSLLRQGYGGQAASFQTLELFKNAKTVGAYMPLPDEVNITPLFNLAGKQFYIPTFDEASGGYRLAEYGEKLKKGKFGILEPANPAFAPEELDLILVPGVAFDGAGHRIGRGGGFYDRLLSQYDAVKVGVCFEFQCLEGIPSEPHDNNVDLLVTESQILKCVMNC